MENIVVFKKYHFFWSHFFEAANYTQIFFLCDEWTVWPLVFFKIKFSTSCIRGKSTGDTKISIAKIFFWSKFFMYFFGGHGGKSLIWSHLQSRKMTFMPPALFPRIHDVTTLAGKKTRDQTVHSSQRKKILSLVIFRTAFRQGLTCGLQNTTGQTNWLAPP